MQTNTKAQAFAQLAEDTATHLTSSLRGWTGFLATVGRLYKYPYHGWGGAAKTLEFAQRKKKQIILYPPDKEVKKAKEN